MREPWHESWDQILELDDSPTYSIELIRRLVAEQPNHGPAWRRLGVMLGRVSRFDEAEAALRKALELAAPQNLVFALCDMGTLARRRGDRAAAELWFRKAIDDSPDDTHGYIYLGSMFARAGRLAEAEAIHRRATLCTSGCVDEAHLNLGFILRACGRYHEALQCIETALELDPEYEAAETARRDILRAIELRSAFPD
jgi:Flp pilus assembly protein TadD